MLVLLFAALVSGQSGAIVLPPSDVINWPSVVLHNVGEGPPPVPVMTEELDDYRQLPFSSLWLGSFGDESAVSVIFNTSDSSMTLSLFKFRPAESYPVWLRASEESAPTPPPSPPTPSAMPPPGPPGHDEQLRKRSDHLLPRTVVPTRVESQVFAMDFFSMPSPYPRAIVATDMDGDGTTDVVITAGGSDGSETFLVLFAPFSETRSAAAMKTSTRYSEFGRTLELIDLDGDGVDEIVTGTPTLLSDDESPEVLGGVVTLFSKDKALSVHPSGLRIEEHKGPMTERRVGTSVAACVLGGPGGSLSPVVGAPHHSAADFVPSGRVLLYAPGTPLSFSRLLDPWSGSLMYFGEHVSCGTLGDGLAVLTATSVEVGQSVPPVDSRETDMGVYINIASTEQATIGAMPDFVMRRSHLVHRDATGLGRFVITADINGDGHLDLITSYLAEDPSVQFGLILLGPLDADQVQSYTIRFVQADGKAITRIVSKMYVMHSGTGPSMLVFNGATGDLGVDGFGTFGFHLPISLSTSGITDLHNVSSTTTFSTKHTTPLATKTVLDDAATSSPAGGAGLAATPAPTIALTDGNASSSTLANVGSGSSSTIVVIVVAVAAVVCVALAAFALVMLRLRRLRGSKVAQASPIALRSRSGTDGRSRSGSRAPGAHQGIRRASSRSLHQQRATAYSPVPRRPAEPPSTPGYVVGDLGGVRGDGAPQRAGTVNTYAMGTLAM